MKKNLFPLAVFFSIMMFVLASCTKTVNEAKPAGAATVDEYKLQEADETPMWLGNAPNVLGRETSLGVLKVFATGLNNPRGLKFSPNGRLYVAEAGIPGNDSTIGLCQQVPFPVGPYHGGKTGGRISKINWRGERFTVTDQLPSSRANEIIGGDVEGVADVAFVDNVLYAVLAGAGCSHGVSCVPNGVVKIKNNGQWKLIANISSWLMDHPAKNIEPDDFEPDGTPYSMIGVNDELYVMEPNHGDMMKVTTNGHITRVIDVSATQGHIVPTALTYHNGNFFMGNLHPFPIVEGISSIYKITPSGQISVWAKGFNTILGVVFDNKGRLYVLENTTGNPSLTPGTGKIIRIDKSGNRKVVTTGLSFPTAITFGPDGKLYVSNWGFGKPPGGGEILQISVKKDDD